MHNHSPGASTYLKQIDLNTSGTPASSPHDERSLFYFFGLSSRQEIHNASTGRLLVSFAPAFRSGYGEPRWPDVHAVVEPGQTAVTRVYAQHVLVWLDPSTLPTTGVPAIVRVSAI